jgi:RNA polymerase sigma factor (sigma-70 family)
MSHLSLRPVLHQLRRLAAPPAGELTDRQLLECFAARHEEAAFAALVRRHGPMVHGVCRRLLRQEQDAEDAFQATFLVLARRAAGLGWHDSVAGWLYQVASRISLKARAQATRRRLQERQARPMPRYDEADPTARWELQELLDEELRRLPEKYRAPVVLCYLEGKSHAEAARQLGWPAGTVKGRLARARQRLRGRLARRGLAPASAAVALLLADQLSPAAVPAALGDAAVRAAGPFAAGSAVGGAAPAQAVALAEAMLQATAAGKLRLCTLLLAALALCGVGAGLLTASWKGGPSAAAAEPPPAAAGARDEPPAPRDGKPAAAGRPAADALRALLAERAGGSVRSEAAVAAGLDWLARHQAADGHWSLNGFDADGHCDCTGPASQKNDTAGTAFGLLPFLAAGITPRSTGKDAAYAKTVERGLAFLRKSQAAEGELPGGMYAHALGTMALCQAYALTGDPALKEPAQQAVNYIVDGQSPRAGGWGYVPRQERSDTSVTGWQVQALKWGELAGLPIPEKTKDGVARWLDSCESPDGGYGYVGPMPTATMTASGLLCRQALGWGKRKPTLVGGVKYLQPLPPGGQPNLYYDYYATQVLYNLGGPRWAGWNRAERDRLVEAQDKGDTPGHAHQKGSWTPERDIFGGAGGRVMTTSLALLVLEVYYRTDLVLAGRPPRPLKAGDLPALWDDLAGDSVPRAQQAVWALARAPEQAVPFLKERLAPARVEVDRRRLDQAVVELDDDTFAVREKAAEDLEKAGELAEPVLRKVVDGKPTPEARRRAEILLEKINEAPYTPEWQRTLRALEALELSGTPEARRLLEALAGGTPEARLTREAKAALDRLEKRPGAGP